MTAHALSPTRSARGKLAGSAAAAVHGPAASSATVQPAALDIGNLALQELMAGGLRTKLEVGGAGDPEEREADALARSVLGGSGGGRGEAPCACGGTCEKCAAGKGGAGMVLRRKPAEGAGLGRPPAVARAFAGSGRPVDAATRARFEPRFGVDLSRVRLHDDARSASMATIIGARAYSAGRDIGFARGQLSPGTPGGQALLAHELAHVVLGHGGVRRLGGSDYADDRFIQTQSRAVSKWAAEKRATDEAAERKHEAWSKAVGPQWQSELPGQSKDISEERARLNLALTGVQAKAFDEAAKEGSWLDKELKAAGYSEPSIATVKQLWGQALVAADALKLGSEAKPKDQPDAKPGVISPEIRLEAMTLIPAYYAAAKTFGAAVEHALKTWADGVNQAAEETYQKELAEHERTDSINDETCKSMRGDLGGGAACAGLRLTQGAPPSRPTPVTIPTPVSTNLEKPTARAQAAQTPAEWGQVAADLQASAIALGKLVTASLPTASPLQKQADAIAALDARLEKFAGEHTVIKRIPAVFYPKDAGQMVKAKDGTESFVADAVPWQFYLTQRAKLDDTNGMCLTQNEWVLHDITNPTAAETTASSSKAEADMIAKGEWVDPPISLFTPLNSKLRFPEGELYFTLPSGTHYVHHMTEPWAWSDYLSAAALFLAAAALVAGVVATGGAAAPAAIALGATIGSAAFGTAATLSEMQEKREHGLLTEKDVDRAMFDIGMNVVSVASLGLGRVVTAPGAAIRFGSKFGAMAATLRVLRFANLGGDVIQASLITADLVQGFQAIDQNPQLSEEQKEKMIASLARRALLTGAMMTIAIKGDVNDVRSSGTLHITGVDADGTPRAGPPVSEEVGPPAPKPHLDADAPDVHTKVSPEVHAQGEANAVGLTLGDKRHAVGVAGSGSMRDLYFCSDFCTTLTTRLSLVVEALPKGHSLLDPCKDMLAKARQIKADLQAGKITEQVAKEKAAELTERMGRIAADTTDGHEFKKLMDANPEALEASMGEVQAALKKGQDTQQVFEEATAKTEAQRQAQLGDLFDRPSVNTHERGTGSATFGDPTALPVYSPRPADKPYFTGDKGIPSAEGAAMATTLRSLFDLPVTADSTRNVAVAEAFVDGKRQLLGTVSGSEVRPGMVELPSKTRFRVIDSGFQTRAEDTERKLLEYLADRLSPNSTGTIRLYTERPACRSCAGVIQQFEKQFPGIKVIVSFGGSPVHP